MPFSQHVFGDMSVLRKPATNTAVPKVNINHRVKHVLQDALNNCWSAAASMIFGSKMSIGPGKGNLLADGRLAMNSVQQFAKSWGLKCEPPASWTVDSLALMLRAGPVAFVGVNAYDTAGKPLGHVVVVSALVGDGTPDGTRITVLDPGLDEADGGRLTLPYSQWMQLYPMSTEYVWHK